jgi:hypothetical protein
LPGIRGHYGTGTFIYVAYFFIDCERFDAIYIFSSPKPVLCNPSVTKEDEPEVANDVSTTKESDEVAVAPHPSCGVEESLLKENPVQESTQRFKAVKVTDFCNFDIVPVLDFAL